MSALVDKVYTLGNLVEFNETGLSIASFVDIKRTLIDRMRQLYGVDIDVSDASVDGQWVTEIALLLNNILQALNNLYANLNPAVAQGAALDLLASFSNIARKRATASICEITLTNNIAFTLSADMTFIDVNGNTWNIDKTRIEDFIAGSRDAPSYDFTAEQMSVGVAIPLICSVLGAIKIPANSIIGFTIIDAASSSVMISQSNAGVQGTIEESDAHLRARRNKSAANEALTIVDGIQGALMNNPSILDAYVINHTTAGGAGTGILAHTVEVIVRSNYPATPNSNIRTFIANTIYNRLTPGIPTTYDRTTTGTTVDVDTAGKNTRRQVIIPNDISTSYNKITEWAEAKPINPYISITVSALPNFDFPTAAAAIIRAVAAYANNLGLLVDMNAASLLQEALFADPKFQGRSTYYIIPNNIEIDTNTDPVPFVNDIPAESSAKANKTFYSYDDSCTANGSAYANANQSIEIYMQ